MSKAEIYKMDALYFNFFLTFPVAMTTFTPLDKASFRAFAVVEEILLLLFNSVPVSMQKNINYRTPTELEDWREIVEESDHPCHRRCS